MSRAALRSTLTLAGVGGLVAGGVLQAAVAGAAEPCVPAADAATMTCTYAGTASEQSFLVPDEVTQLGVALPASGDGAPRELTTLAVAPGSTLVFDPAAFADLTGAESPEDVAALFRVVAGVPDGDAVPVQREEPVTPADADPAGPPVPAVVVRYALPVQDPAPVVPDGDALPLTGPRPAEQPAPIAETAPPVETVPGATDGAEVPAAGETPVPVEDPAPVPVAGPVPAPVEDPAPAPVEDPAPAPAAVPVGAEEPVQPWVRQVREPVATAPVAEHQLAGDDLRTASTATPNGLLDSRGVGTLAAVLGGAFGLAVCVALAAGRQHRRD